MRAFILTLALLALPSQATPTLTAQTVLEKHTQALGPIEKIKSRRVQMRILGMAPFDIPLTIESARPNLIRKDVTLQGSVQVTAFDGKQAWKTDPFVPGGNTPTALPADEAKALLLEADFDGTLIQPAAKGIKVAYQGPATIDGKPAHALRVTQPTGEIATVWLDATTYLEFKRTQPGPVMGQVKNLDIFTSDYRVVDGVQIPYKVEIGLSGAKEKMSILVDKVELNPRIDPARFAKPAAK